MNNRAYSTNRQFPPPLKFTTPQIITLKYQQGKMCRGGESVMFTTTTGERFFVDPPMAAEIQLLADGPMEIHETHQGFTVRRVPSHDGHINAGPVNGQGQNSAQIMSRCYQQAIDVALQAVEYAKGRNLMLAPSFEDIRALAATICISETRK